VVYLFLGGFRRGLEDVLGGCKGADLGQVLPDVALGREHAVVLAHLDDALDLGKLVLPEDPLHGLVAAEDR